LNIVPTLFFAAVACATTWPLVASLTSHLGAPQGPGDPFLNLWVLGWDLETISAHPAWLLTGRIFNANIFYPSIGTLAYTDHQIIQALAVWPLYAATGNPTLCYNVVLILSLILSAWAMFAFVRSVTGSTPAAYCAGLVWGFCPYHFGHLIHIQLQSLYWMPLTFWLLHRLVAGRRKRDAVGLGVVVALQMVSSVYYGMIGGVGLIVAAAVIVWRTGRLPVLLVRRTALAAVVAVVVALPGLWPYWLVQQREGFGRTLFEAGHHSATLTSYLQAPPTNLLYGRSGWLESLLHKPSDPSRGGPELDLFPGFVVLALAAAGLVRARKLDMTLLAASMAAVGAVGLLLSLGPLGVRPLYAALHNWVFGFQAIRSPSRFSVLAFFALAVLAGIGLEALVRRSSRDRSPGWPAMLALALIVAEYSNGAIGFAPAPEHSTPVGRWLRDAQEPGPVLYLPMGKNEIDSSAMVVSLEHRRPIVNGHSGLRPALYQAIVDQLATFPDAIALLTLRDLGVRFVVVPDRLVPSASLSPLVERAAFTEGVIYELRWTPEIAAAYDEADSVLMPLPGSLPFQVSERSRYYVRWVGGPVALPAGEAVISAERAADGGLRIDVHASTAGWVRSFFEADDRLSSETDANLLPRVYREILNEGRRRARRTVEFDPSAKRVMVTNGESAPVTLPLRLSARDPLSALFYVRTLPLGPDFQSPVLVNDAGRNTTVNVKVTAAESIVIDGRTHEAWKLEPALVERIAWREPPRATVWVSRDGRKVPLLIRVSGSFGTMDVELAEYEGH
jgi:hypothetical protein